MNTMMHSMMGDIKLPLPDYDRHTRLLEVQVVVLGPA